MNIVLIVFIVLLNLFSIVLVYKMLSSMELSDKMKIIIISEIIMYVMVQIIYNLSSGNIPENIAKKSRTMLVFTFLPINMMVLFAPIAKNLAKIKSKELKKEKFKEKIIRIILIDIIIIICETMYLNSIQSGIIKMIER